MRPKAAFVRWMTSELGRAGAEAAWDDAVAGSPQGAAYVAAWLATDGFVHVTVAKPAQLRRSFDKRRHNGKKSLPLPQDYFDLGAAVLIANGRGINSGQILRAKYGDIEPQRDGLGYLCWYGKGYATGHSFSKPMKGGLLLAVKVLVKHGRTAPPAPDAPLLAGEWDVRKLRTLALRVNAVLAERKITAEQYLAEFEIPAGAVALSGHG